MKSTVNHPPKRSRRWILVLVSLVLLTSGGLYFYFNPKKALVLAVPELTNFDYVKFKVEEDTLIFETKISLTNKSPFGMEVDTLDIKLKLGDSLLIDKMLTKVFDIPAKGVQEIPFSLRIHRKKFHDILESLQDQDSTDFSMDINADYNTFLGHIALPYSITKRIPVPIPPKVRVLKLERHKFKFSDKTMKAEVYLEIENRGRLNMNIHELYYDMSLNNDLVKAEGTFNQEVKIEPRTTKQVMIPITIQVNRPLKVYMMILTDNDDMHYTLRLKANVDEHMLFDKSAPVTFYKEGVMELKKDGAGRKERQAKKADRKEKRSRN